MTAREFIHVRLLGSLILRIQTAMESGYARRPLIPHRTTHLIWPSGQWRRNSVYRYSNFLLFPRPDKPCKALRLVCGAYMSISLPPSAGSPSSQLGRDRTYITRSQGLPKHIIGTIGKWCVIRLQYLHVFAWYDASGLNAKEKAMPSVKEVSLPLADLVAVYLSNFLNSKAV